MNHPLTLEIACENGVLLYSTTDMNDLRLLRIPETIEHFPVKSLSVGTTFSLLPNAMGYVGTYRVTRIKTYIGSFCNGEGGGSGNHLSLNISYIVEKVG